jgi:superfamily II DNA or RNA helicase
MHAILADALYVPKVWVEEHPGVLQSFTYRFEQKVDFGYNDEEDNPILEEFIKTYRIVGEYYAFCRGDLEKLHNLFSDFEFDDRRTNKPLEIDLKFTGTLRDDQKLGLKTFIDPNLGGIFQAKPGYGKTVVMVAYTTMLKQNMLLLVEKIDLKDQFIERLRSFTNINELEEASGKKLVGELTFKDGEPVYYPITVTTYQLLIRDIIPRLKSIQNLFGLVMVDECHLAPAASLTKIIQHMNPLVFVGVSATPKRKDNYHILLPDLIGPVRFISAMKNTCKIIVISGTFYEFKDSVAANTMSFPSVVSMISKTKSRNEKIITNIIADLNTHRRILVLSERVDHVNLLSKMLVERGIAAAGITGTMKVADRNSIIDRLYGIEKAIAYVQDYLPPNVDLEDIKTWPDFLEELKKYDLKSDILDKVNEIYNHKIDCIVATKQLFSLGTDIPCIDTLHITCPSANPVYLEQGIGRIQRDYPRKQEPKALYYADGGLGILYGCNNIFRRTCKNLGYEIQDLTSTKAIENDMNSAL